MKKDIHIPEVRDVHIAAVKEINSETKASGWNVYIINDKTEDIDLVIIVSHGFSETKKTSTLRKTLNQLPQKSFAKLEILPDDLFKFTNNFKVSFFLNDRLYDKNFTFKPDTITDKNLSEIPLMSLKGVLAE